MINKIDDGSASLAFPDFCLLIGEKAKELDPETHFKDTFRVFSKDEEGLYYIVLSAVTVLYSAVTSDYFRLHSSR